MRASNFCFKHYSKNARTNLSLQEAVQAIFRFFAEAGRKAQGGVQDFVVHALNVAVVEGR